ncbi:dnaJ homolog subfamily C member 21-like [Dermatophagoides pteronyssinus]|uniref:dnaJ homolog subfamily C member 21-like n=1 Tax=Dermatophagoides pteronyssinus TaxID=6956 RepID=UPI003F678F7E
MFSDNHQTFYDILNIKNDATIDQIKKNYRSLALKYHPDKNLDNVVETTAIFNRIQEAYEILSDPEKRNWYDNHRDVFHKDLVDVSEYEIDEKYFQPNCYNGYNDDDNGFYTVYRKLFEDIIAQEIRFYDDPKDFEYPTFGDSNSDLKSVKYFYDIWQSFKTVISFNQLDKYDIRQAPNRRFGRFMERENEKIREQARKQRNLNIQKLVKWLRSRDKRMKKYAEHLAEKNRDNRKKSEQQRRKKIQENLNISNNYVETNGFKLSEEQWLELEATLDNEVENNRQMKKEKKNKTTQPTTIVDDSIDDMEIIGTQIESIDLKPKSRIDPDDDGRNNNQIDCANNDDNDDTNLLYICDVCNKNFKSLNSYNNHLKSKKHLNNVKLYVQMAANDNDDDDDDD